MPGGLGPWRGGGEHSDTEWLPTAKRPRGMEVVNAKIYRQSTPLKAKKGGSQLQTKTLILWVVTYNMFSLYFVKYMKTLHEMLYGRI